MMYCQKIIKKIDVLAVLNLEIRGNFQVEKKPTTKKVDQFFHICFRPFATWKVYI